MRRPESIKIVGVRYFDVRGLGLVCDPSISPLNFMIMGEYYKKLTEHIYSGKEVLKV